MTVASVHVADVGFASAVRGLRGPRRAPGLRHADAAIAAPLSADGRLTTPELGRLALVAFWDDHASVTSFLAKHPFARRLAGGWRAQLEPLRAFGEWPGLDDDVPRDRATPDHHGPAIVTTLGRLRVSQTRRFLQTSRPAEVAAHQADGFLWGTALARPPFVATLSIWSSAESLSRYAYGAREPAHRSAIDEDRHKPFHHRSAFIRWRIVEQAGQLDDKPS
jgi:hypothetical protein